MERAKLINKYLKNTYGCSLNGRPRFRLVWSEDLREVRKGLFSPLQVFETVENRPKYSFLKDRWVLEIDTFAYADIFGRAIAEKDKTVMKGDGYEPLKAFQNRKGEYLPPDMEICKIICDRWVELVNRPEGQRLTRKQASYDDAAIMKKETQKFFEILTQEGTDWKFKDGESVIIQKGA